MHNTLILRATAIWCHLPVVWRNSLLFPSLSTAATVHLALSVCLCNDLMLANFQVHFPHGGKSLPLHLEVNDGLFYCLDPAHCALRSTAEHSTLCALESLLGNSILLPQDPIDRLVAELPNEPYHCGLCDLRGLDLGALLIHELSHQHQSMLESEIVRITGADASGTPIPGKSPNILLATLFSLLFCS